MEETIEQNVIGAIILHPENFSEVSGILTEKDFKLDLYRRAFLTIKRMYEQNIDLDLSSLYMEMGRPEHTVEKIANFIDNAFLSPMFYANQLKKRNLEDEIKRTVQEREFDKTQEKIKEIEILGKPVSLYSIQKMIECRESFSEYFPTGFTDLDRYVKFRPTDLMVIAGHPSTGKSSLGLSMLGYMAKSLPVALISFEMSLPSIGNRLTHMYSFNYLNEINKNFIATSPSAFNLQEVRKALRKTVNELGAKVVLVDYLQIMQEPRRYESRRLEVTAIIRGLKEMAKEFNIGMIVISSLSRQLDHGEKARPNMGQLKESGDIEYCSDEIIFLHPLKEGKAELIIDKNRHGKAKKIINIVWLEDKICYGTLSQEEQQRLPYKDDTDEMSQM